MPEEFKPLTVQLRPATIVDLALRFTEDLGNNKLRQYVVSTAYLMVSASLRGKEDTFEQGAFESVRKYILEAEGRDAELIEAPKKYSFNPSLVEGAIEVTDVHREVLTTRKLRRSLKKRSVKSQILQYRHYNNWKEILSDKFSNYFNKFADTTLGRWLDIPYRQYVYQHKMVACTYLAYTYEPHEKDAAFARLGNDLKILDAHDLILGHLALPSTIRLADSLGTGRSPEAVFCFLFLDEDKLDKLVGKKENYYHRDLSKLFISSAISEGSAGSTLDGKSIESRYEIEEIDIAKSLRDTAHEVYLESYQDSRKAILETAKDMQRQIDALGEKVSRSTTVGKDVFVEVAFVKKD